MAIHIHYISDYRTLLKAIEQACFQYYLFNSPDIKLKKYVNRGLTVDFQTEDIIKELESKGIMVETVA